MFKTASILLELIKSTNKEMSFYRRKDFWDNGTGVESALPLRIASDDEEQWSAAGLLRGVMI